MTYTGGQYYSVTSQFTTSQFTFLKIHGFMFIFNFSRELEGNTQFFQFTISNSGEIPGPKKRELGGNTIHTVCPGKKFQEKILLK